MNVAHFLAFLVKISYTNRENRICTAFFCKLCKFRKNQLCHRKNTTHLFDEIQDDPEINGNDDIEVVIYSSAS